MFERSVYTLQGGGCQLSVFISTFITCMHSILERCGKGIMHVPMQATIVESNTSLASWTLVYSFKVYVHERTYT